MKMKLGHRCDDCGRKISFGFVHDIEIRDEKFQMCDDCYTAIFKKLMQTRRSIEENCKDEIDEAV